MVNARELVRPLEASWQDAIDETIRAIDPKTRATTRDPARLGAKVAALSNAYNSGVFSDLPLEARIGFSFPRDVPKGAAAVRELIATGTLSLPSDRPLRIVDLGAGVGAMSWGIARAFEAAGASGRIETLLVDENRGALAAAESIAARISAQRLLPNVAMSVQTRSAPILTSGAANPFPRADIVVLGQVLSELDPGVDPAMRLTRHANLLANLLESVVAEDGALIVVEPALRDRTRHLHAVRDALSGRVTIFAPCLHCRGCPALAVETDWCHEDLPVDLPEWLVPVAREAGLRWERLTLSYLVLRRDGHTLREALFQGRRPALRFRAISRLLVTKGKREVHGCTEAGEQTLFRCLDRDADALEAFADVSRGDVVEVTAPQPNPEPGTAQALPILDRGRLRRDLTIDVWPPHR